ncbi:putative uncharacterized protein [Firmicutes bacterium CAG:882]|nr:putative uncharacterized protein [Firmicutes bacterium CAG:882]
MKKGEHIEGKVVSVAFPNKGKAVCGDDIVTVKNAIPGQVLDIRIDKVRNGRAEGHADAVIRESTIVDESIRCRHFGRCGGCVYQPVRYEEQLNIKREQIEKLLAPVGGDYTFEGIKGSPAVEEYRNKMEFSFGDEVKDGPLSLGMHKRGSFHDIVTVDGCRIMDADFRKILSVVLDYFTICKTPFYKKLQHEGYLRHLLVRKAVKTQEIIVDLVTTSQMDAELEHGVLAGFETLITGLGATGQLKGKIAGVLHTVNDSLADAVCNDRTDILYGQDFFYEELLGLKFKITPFSFFQTNSLGAEVLYDTVRSYIGDTKDKIVFDLYSGTGTIAQLAAAVAKHVVGVEIVREAVEAAGENAELNGLTNCDFLAGDVLKVIDEIEEKPDLLILDPPRDGIHPKALPKLIAYGVERIVYVSCKPTSLVRDMEVFNENGYYMEKAVAVDMFPGTANTEVVALIVKKH